MISLTEEGFLHLIITVASGKGGTGKTTVAVNLALALGSATLLDCDVEEPNAHTLLRLKGQSEYPVTVPTPVVDQEKCTLCGDCQKFCQFNAIFVGKSVLVYDKICHSCGGCALVCPTGAIREEERRVGSVYQTNSEDIQLVYGSLNIGEPVAISVIKAVKSRIDHDKINILDAPPGTACLPLGPLPMQRTPSRQSRKQAPYSMARKTADDHCQEGRARTKLYQPRDNLSRTGGRKRRPSLHHWSNRREALGEP